MTEFLSSFPSRPNIAPSGENTIAPTLTNMTTTKPAADDKAKRLTACLVCRKRKLKCDSARPKCSSCARLGHAW